MPRTLCRRHGGISPAPAECQSRRNISGIISQNTHNRTKKPLTGRPPSLLKPPLRHRPPLFSQRGPSKSVSGSLSALFLILPIPPSQLFRIRMLCFREIHGASVNIQLTAVDERSRYFTVPPGPRSSRIQWLDTLNESDPPRWLFPHLESFEALFSFTALSDCRHS